MSKTAREGFAENLLQYLNESPTAYHAVENGVELLRKSGFQELKETQSWSLCKGGKYFVVKNRSAVIAFIVGEGDLEETWTETGGGIRLFSIPGR